ncbi:MAG: HK97 family phage prohead protease [Terracidiphilus sp.]
MRIYAAALHSRNLRMGNPDVLCYYNHDTGSILGRVSSGTLEVAEDDKGLRFSVKLPDTSYANDLVSLMERGDLRGCSFGFATLDDTWEQVGDDQVIRTLNEVRLFEGSIVGEPAYLNGPIANLRSAPAEVRAKLKAKAVRTSASKTKKVDGVELTHDCFAYVGDVNDPETWKLPIKFPGDETETVNHIKGALARFDQTEGIPDSEKQNVFDRIVAAAKEHGIDVSEQNSLRNRRDEDNPCNPDSDNYDPTDPNCTGAEDDEEECSCDCRSCEDGECDACTEVDCGDDFCSMCPNQDAQRSDSLRVRHLFASLHRNKVGSL